MTDDCLLPLELRQALDAAAVGVSGSDLHAAAARLSVAYRDGPSMSPALNDLAALAYAATRMPATFAATRAVFQELRERCDGLSVETLLDLGAGPATTLWAADLEFPQLVRARLIERDPAMRSMGQRLLECSSLGDRIRTPPTTTATITVTVVTAKATRDSDQLGTQPDDPTSGSAPQASRTR